MLKKKNYIYVYNVIQTEKKRKREFQRYLIVDFKIVSNPSLIIIISEMPKLR